MTCNAKDLLISAQKICAMAEDAAMFRSAISRLYYSAFHCCREFEKNLDAPGSVGKAEGIHEQLIAMLGTPDRTLSNNKQKTSKKLGANLRNLCLLRVDSDYYLDRPVTKEALDAARGYAESIFKLA